MRIVAFFGFWLSACVWAEESSLVQCQLSYVSSEMSAHSAESRSFVEVALQRDSGTPVQELPRHRMFKLAGRYPYFIWLGRVQFQVNPATKLPQLLVLRVVPSRMGKPQFHVEQRIEIPLAGRHVIQLRAESGRRTSKAKYHLDCTSS